MELSFLPYIEDEGCLNFCLSYNFRLRHFFVQLRLRFWIKRDFLYQSDLAILVESDFLLQPCQIFFVVKELFIPASPKIFSQMSFFCANPT